MTLPTWITVLAFGNTLSRSGHSRPKEHIFTCGRRESSWWWVWQMATDAMIKTLVLFIPLIIQGTIIAGEPLDTRRSDLRLSLGKISQTKSGYLTVVGPKERAVRTSGKHSKALLRFRYRGPSEKTAPLDSGAVVRQIGLKMRAMNTCNLMYVMWRIKPTEEIYIAIKRNPGKTTYKACRANGYIVLGRIPLKPLGITAATQKTHRLGASVTETAGRYAGEVTIDGRRIWSREIDAKLISNINGPVGIRSDNGSFIFKLFVSDSGSSSK